MDGNSIYALAVSFCTGSFRERFKAYQTFIWGQEDCDTSVNLTNSQGDEHLGNYRG